MTRQDPGQAEPSLQPLRLEGVVPYPEAFASRYRDRGYWAGRTHAGLLARSAGEHAERTAVIAGERSWSYAGLAQRAMRIAAGLQALGVRRGDRVIVHLPNMPEYLAIIFALFELGAIPVLALAAHRRSEIRYFADFAQARAYITVDHLDGAKLGLLAAELREACPALSHTIVLSREHPGEDDGLAPLLAHEPLPHSERTLPGDVAFLQLSGGTTGRPKMIPRTHDDYLYSVHESNRICGVSRDTVQLAVLPVSHNFTMSSPGVLGALAAGATIVLAPGGVPDIAFPLIEQHRVTQVSLVPPLLLAWLNSSLRERYDLSSLRVIQVGGAKLSAEAARRVRPELGATLQQVFGMAEGLVNYTRLDDDEQTITTTQGLRISPDDEVRIVDEEDRDVPAGQSGQLLTRGPYTIRGYYRAPEHDALSFTADGFYRTGDIASADERGYLTVLGRAKDQINRGGEKIAPEEVENMLLAHEAVHDASLVGVPDELLGERTKAYLILREGAEAAPPGATEVKRFLRDRGLAAFKIPDTIEFVREFPSTGVGKISKQRQRTPRASS